MKNIPLTEIAQAQGIRQSQVSRILLLALLAPDIVEMIHEARMDHALILERLGRAMPADWRSSKPGVR